MSFDEEKLAEFDWHLLLFIFVSLVFGSYAIRSFLIRHFLALFNFVFFLSFDLLIWLIHLRRSNFGSVTDRNRPNLFDEPRKASSSHKSVFFYFVTALSWRVWLFDWLIRTESISNLRGWGRNFLSEGQARAVYLDVLFHVYGKGRKFPNFQLPKNGGNGHFFSQLSQPTDRTAELILMAKRAWTIGSGPSPMAVNFEKKDSQLSRFT